MSDYTIEISPTSKVIIFQGTLKKAPQLNKRGRKKWKDRFILLRACKTLECFKSKKALESSKAPRKVIDLRECINLEVGLEYKELQHIFSLGTFKRTFFFGAPSDALMLQWVDNIEKVKNAIDGDKIRILDIGLRKSPMRTISGISTSQSMSKIAALCSSNPAINQIDSISPPSRSSVAMSHITKHSQLGRDAIFDKECRSPSLPPQREISSISTHVHQYVSNGSTENSPEQSQRVRSQTHEGGSPSHRRGHYYVNVSPRAPPVKGNSPPVLPKASPENLPTKTKKPTSSPPKNSTGQHSPEHVIPSKIPPPKIASRAYNGASPHTDDKNPFAALIHHQKYNHRQDYHSLYDSSRKEPLTRHSEQQHSHRTPAPHGMKRSFRYRQITLKKENPVFNNIKEDEELSSDEEEGDIERSERNGTIYHKRELAKSSPNLSEIGRPKAGRVRNGTRPSLHACSNTQYIHQPFFPTYNPYQVTSYSKVTVVGVKVQNCSPSLCSPTHIIDEDHHHNLHPNSFRNSNSDGALCSPRPDTIVLPQAEEPCDENNIALPERHSSDAFNNFETISISSLDDIVVAPPLMFDDPTKSPTSESNNQQQVKTDHDQTVSSQEIDINNEGSPNRNSTESSDTGYTSSPSYNRNIEGGDGNWCSDVEGSPLPNSSERHCVPMVFYTKHVWKPGGKGKGLLGIQVCLVEQCSSIIEDLLALKELEGFKLLECEEEHGRSTVTTPNGDVLTVETSLEDLEFGFKVVKSTQKDLLSKKVKAFDFEVKNLFSNNQKPFSCEVHIRHLNDIIILPVELD